MVKKNGLCLGRTLWEGSGEPSWRVVRGEAEQGWERENGHAKISAKCSQCLERSEGLPEAGFRRQIESKADCKYSHCASAA